jgi:hypothetical protein
MHFPRRSILLGPVIAAALLYGWQSSDNRTRADYSIRPVRFTDVHVTDEF